MADSKKYYYMKVKEDFFETDEMIMLQSMPDGYYYSDILMKLYLRSLKGEGKLMFNNMIPYNAQMIAAITRHQLAVVEKALRIFKDLGLIEILDNGAIYMMNIQNFIGQSSSSADRMREYRMKVDKEKEMLEDTNVVTNVVTNVTTNVERTCNISAPEIETRDRDRDKDKNTSKDVYIEADKKQDEDKAIYEGVKQAFNIDCPSLPKCKELSDKRKKAIKACWKKYGPDKIREAFKMAEASDFLSGRSKKWKASFDWLMNTNNMLKVLEGNYINEKDTSKHTDTKGISRDIPSYIPAMNGHEVDSL